MGRTDSPDGFERAVGAFDRLQAWLGAIGILGTGALLWWGPGAMAEEIPIHRELGAGFGAFGVLFVLALTLRGRAGARARNLVGGLALALFAAGLGYVAVTQARAAWELAERGEVVEATVERSTVGFRGGKATNLATVTIDGRRRTVEGLGRPARGATVRLLTHPDRAEWTMPLPPDRTFVAILAARGHRWSALGTAIGALLLAAWALVLLWSFVVGAEE